MEDPYVLENVLCERDNTLVTVGVTPWRESGWHRCVGLFVEEQDGFGRDLAVAFLSLDEARSLRKHLKLAITLLEESA